MKILEKKLLLLGLSVIVNTSYSVKNKDDLAMGYDQNSQLMRFTIEDNYQLAYQGVYFLNIQGWFLTSRKGDDLVSIQMICDDFF